MVTMSHASLFTTPEHEPFYWRGGTAAALLIHGFPGTRRKCAASARRCTRMGGACRGCSCRASAATSPPSAKDVMPIGSTPSPRRWRSCGRTTQPSCWWATPWAPPWPCGPTLHHPVDGVVLFAPFWRVDSWLDKTYPWPPGCCQACAPSPAPTSRTRAYVRGYDSLCPGRRPGRPGGARRHPPPEPAHACVGPGAPQRSSSASRRPRTSGRPS